eukprot:TRINITY_DN47116_c0_g1_i1.p1 TRINITY_DN47116_c0_g1~~TRINITY_DN47116_c0_g1_i1.p1  ORF type:complete len:888 (+),score=235.11 TRINITY_DN47116_c0_g1_i1:59-2665(+)
MAVAVESAPAESPLRSHSSRFWSRDRSTPSLVDSATDPGWLRRVLREQRQPRGRRVLATPLIPLGPLRCMSPTSAPPASPGGSPRGRVTAAASAPTPEVAGSPEPGTTLRPLRGALRTPAADPAAMLAHADTDLLVPPPVTAGGSKHISVVSRATTVHTTVCPGEPGTAMPGSSGTACATSPTVTLPGAPYGARETVEQIADAPVLVDDQFSGDEKAIARLLSVARSDPVAFSDDLESEYILRPPEVPSPQNVRRARVTLAALREKLADTTKESAAQQEQHALEAATVQDQLDELSGSCHTPTGKKPAPKPGAKGKKQATPQENAEDPRKLLMQLRDATLKRHAEEAAELQSRLHAVTTATASCAEGVRRVDAALAALRAQRPLRPLRYTRGLSLAARDRAAAIGESSGDSSVGDADWGQVQCRYGLPLGKAAVAVTIGARSAIGAAFDSLCNPVSREAILRPEMGFVGCGWQRHRSSCSVAVVALAEGFSDCRHVRLRAHCALAEVRHQFGSTIDPFLFPINFLGDHGVEAVNPAEHPVSCSGVAQLRLRVPEGTDIDAHLESVREGPVDPKQPQGVSVFVQREAVGRVRIVAALPHEGSHALHVFARRSGCVSYDKIGAVLLTSSGWGPGQRPAQFPDPTTQFAQSRVTLLEPFRSPLASEVPTTFAVRLPTAASDLARRIEQLKQQQADKDACAEQAEREAARVAQELLDHAHAQEAAAAKVAAAGKEATRKPRDGTPGDQNASRRASKSAAVTADVSDADDSCPRPTPPARTEADVRQLRRKANTLRTQSRLLALAVAREELAAGSAASEGHTVELVTGSSRKVLRGVGTRRGVTTWRREGVALETGSAALLVDGVCVLRWTVN